MDIKEVQDALTELNEIGTYPTWMRPLVEAARKWANPDYEAAAKDLNYTLSSEGLSIHFDAVDMEGIVDAALGITEDTG